MCDIKTKTNLTTKTVYKVVRKEDKDYYAYFSGFPIKIGKVDLHWDDKHNDNFMKYNPASNLYNYIMTGKTSGFAKLISAQKLHKVLNYANVILKMKLGGEIWKGTGKNISDNISERIITYAGTEILSFKEIK